MTALKWDEVGERRYEMGVDRGVLFLPGQPGVAWNGLTAVEDSTTPEVQSFYMDGAKFLERHVLADYAGTLKALTYPDEFEVVLGIKTVHPGLVYYDQQPTPFNLCYRTKVGNDVDGDEHGYRIHILYNLMAVSDAETYSSMGESPQVSEFSWKLSGVPPRITGYRPSQHVAINSLETDPDRLAAIESLLYGTDTTDPTLPDFLVFSNLFDQYNSLIIIDNGDGTWTGADLLGNYIDITSPTEFSIHDADVVILDPDTYTISTTTP